MEQQVAEAALAMVRPTTDGTTRMAASQFLDQWTRSPEAWGIYASWLRSFRDSAKCSSNHAETVGMQLLCLTLLQGKIRREVPRGTVADAALLAVQSEIVAFLQAVANGMSGGGGSGGIDSSVITPLCVCTAALAARCGKLNDMILTCSQSAGGGHQGQGQAGQPGVFMIPPNTSLRILACIPTEVEAIADLTTPQVTNELSPSLEVALDTIRRALASEETAAPALEALRNWAAICHVSLSQLNTPTCGGNESLLPPLIQILSTPQPMRSDILVSASQALMEAILVPSDTCTPARQAASALLVNAIPSGFVVAPLTKTTQEEWDDASHALATLVCTLVTEEVDDFCTQPAEPCLNLLLQIQSHPHTPVAISALECWLTVQELPAESRHDNWKAPLFVKVVQGLLSRIAYPQSFTNWQDELDVDMSEFEELRRMVKDVFVSSYFLLRAQFVEMMVSTIISSTHWQQAESALFCLSTVSREVCARIKARAGGTSVSSDRDSTAQHLLRLVEQLCGAADAIAAAKSAASRHPLVLAGVVKFVGSHAPAWNVKCSVEALLQLLAYLRAAMLVSSSPQSTASITISSIVTLDSAKSARSILVNCSNRLLITPTATTNNSTQGQLFTSIKETVDTVLSTDDDEAMATVAEGCTRLLVQIKDENMVRQSLATLLGPVLQRAETALKCIPTAEETSTTLTPDQQRAIELLGKYLHVLQVIIRFCDSGPINDVIISVWPILELTSSKLSENEYIIEKLLLVHEQLLKNAPEFVGSYLEQTIKFVVQVYETYKHASSLQYIAGAVESFGSSNVKSFADLLSHVSVVTFTYVSTTKRADECPDLIKSFFEMNQRYIIYCPAALVNCQQFTTIVSFGVECLVSCKGERESTRATLNFLTQLFGWRTLRIPDNNAAMALSASSSIIDEQLVQHGRNITKSCIAGLVGGPTMLWPALSECLFAVIYVVITNSPQQQQQQPVDENANPHHNINNNTIAHQWMYEAAAEAQQQQQQQDNCGAGGNGNNNQQIIPSETYQQVVNILMNLARNGPKSKPKAKMLLTDFAKIAKGEMAPDALVAYSLG